MDSIKHISVDTSSKRQVLPCSLCPSAHEKKKPACKHASSDRGSHCSKAHARRPCRGAGGHFASNGRAALGKVFFKSAGVASKGAGRGFWRVYPFLFEKNSRRSITLRAAKHGGRSCVSFPYPLSCLLGKGRLFFQSANQAVDYYYAKRDLLQKLEPRARPAAQSFKEKHLPGGKKTKNPIGNCAGCRKGRAAAALWRAHFRQYPTSSSAV